MNVFLYWPTKHKVHNYVKYFFSHLKDMSVSVIFIRIYWPNHSFQPRSFVAFEVSETTETFPPLLAKIISKK